MAKPDNNYLFGMWDSLDAFIKEGDEGLYYDLNGNRTNTQTFNARQEEYSEDALRGNPTWYEVDTSRPLLDQVQISNLTRFVNQGAINDYQRVSEDIKQKIDLGGVLEKDRLKASEDPTGIFSFGLASPSLYRVVEWYVVELDILVDGNFVESQELSNKRTNFYTYVDGKQYSVRRQQKGTFEMLKNNPNAKLVEVSADMFATKPSTYVDANGHTTRLKFATKAKKIYLVRPKKGGAPQYIDLFIIAGGLAELNSEGMMAKITPVLMLAEQLEQAGVKTRIYGLRAYNRGNDAVFFSWVAKEYGAPVDRQQVAVVTADPRFFRFSMWKNTEGIMKKRFRSANTGYGSTIYGGTDLSEGFLRYKNYLGQEAEKGLMRTKVKDKALFITGGLPSPDNTFANNEQAIEEEFYRISDIAELALAEKPEKAIRRIVARDRGRNKTDYEIKNRLIRSMNEAFLTADRRTTRYSNSDEETKKLREREDRIIQAINSVIQ
jgi:hypothetical protein